MTLDQASKGFKNQGQFIAALHVSRNLNIPFADLKTAMTGINPTVKPGTGTTPTTGTTTTTTGTPTSETKLLSLGQAIQKLRPGTDSTTATTTAEHQASSDLTSTTSTTTSTSTTTRKKSGR